MPRRQGFILSEGDYVFDQSRRLNKALSASPVDNFNFDSDKRVSLSHV